MTYAHDITGKHFGRLTAVSRADNARTVSGAPIVNWHCVCSCGEEVVVRARNLTSGNTTSCGCWKREFVRANETHGKSRTNTYGVWNTMRQRCENSASKAYPYYGGRGITVCERWKSFPNFLADMGEQPPDKSIERIDNNGPYSPENCRWATRVEQGANKRNNRLVTYCGQTRTLAALAKHLGITTSALRYRIKHNQIA